MLDRRCGYFWVEAQPDGFAAILETGVDELAFGTPLGLPVLLQKKGGGLRGPCWPLEAAFPPA